MGKNRIWILFACVSIVALTGCGTIANRGMQEIQVSVRGSRTALCDITTSVTRNSGNFPGKATVERSREPLILNCIGQDNKHKKLTVRPVLSFATGGNVFTGVVPGMAYDMASGGMWLYPQEIIVDFRYPDLPTEPQWPEEILAEIPAAELGDMPGMLYAPETTGLPNNVSLMSPQSIDPNAVPAPVGLMGDERASQAPLAVTNMQPIVSPEDYESAKPRKKAKAKKPAPKKADVSSTSSEPSAPVAAGPAPAAPAEMADELLPDVITESVPNEATLVPPSAPVPVPAAPAPAAAAQQPATAIPAAPLVAPAAPVTPSTTPAPAPTGTVSTPKSGGSLIAVPEEKLPTQ